MNEVRTFPRKLKALFCRFVVALASVVSHAWLSAYLQIYNTYTLNPNFCKDKKGSVAKACGKTLQCTRGFRQAYLPYFLLYQNVKERWINKSYLFFHHSRLVSNLPFWVQRYNMYTAKSKFFDPLISHLESFPHPKIGIQPFIYGLSRAFSTREKKWNRDITCYRMPIHKTYETVTFFLTPMLLPPHLFTTDPS